MKLKHAILERLNRDDLKEICDRLEIDDVDRRSVEAMRVKLSRLRRASPEVLLDFLYEDDVKVVAEAVGIEPDRAQECTHREVGRGGWKRGSRGDRTDGEGSEG